jgi:hypothetical protein
MPNTSVNKKILFIDPYPTAVGAAEVYLSIVYSVKTEELVRSAANLENSLNYDLIILEPYTFSERKPLPADTLNFYKQLHDKHPVILFTACVEEDINSYGLQKSVHFNEYLSKQANVCDLGKLVEKLIL